MSLVFCVVVVVDVVDLEDLENLGDLWNLRDLVLVCKSVTQSVRILSSWDACASKKNINSFFSFYTKLWKNLPQEKRCFNPERFKEYLYKKYKPSKYSFILMVQILGTVLSQDSGLIDLTLSPMHLVWDWLYHLSAPLV